MALHRNLAEHDADPPSSWRVEGKAGSWHLVSAGGRLPNSYPTRKAAEQDKHHGFYVQLYNDEGRWFHGQPVLHWRRLKNPAMGPAGGFLDPAVVPSGRSRTRAALVHVTHLANGKWRGTVVDEQGKPIEYQDFATKAAAEHWKRDEMMETHVGKGRARVSRAVVSTIHGPMARITYSDPDGSRHGFDIPDITLMAARRNFPTERALVEHYAEQDRMARHMGHARTRAVGRELIPVKERERRWAEVHRAAKSGHPIRNARSYALFGDGPVR